MCYISTWCRHNEDSRTSTTHTTSHRTNPLDRPKSRSQLPFGRHTVTKMDLPNYRLSQFAVGIPGIILILVVSCVVLTLAVRSGPDARWTARLPSYLLAGLITFYLALCLPIATPAAACWGIPTYLTFGVRLGQAVAPYCEDDLQARTSDSRREACTECVRSERLFEWFNGDGNWRLDKLDDSYQSVLKMCSFYMLLWFAGGLCL